MKKTFLLLLILLGMNSIQQAQVVIDTNGAILTLEKTEVGFGTVEKGSDRDRLVKFTNTGKANLVIDTCLGSCGCTTPLCPQGIAIKPGETKELKISYDTERLGAFTKTVTIRSNASNGSNIILYVKGTIIPKKE
jgi:hypothetical protein